MSIYSIIKESITARDVAEHYGLKVGRNGMMCCPFHDDKTPSMKIDKNFICFGCQEKGDVIRFAQLLFNAHPYYAALKLADDFGLDTNKRDPRNNPMYKKQVMIRARERCDKFEKTVQRIYRAYCDYLHLLNDWRVRYAPKSPEEEFHPLFVEALQKTDQVEYLLDCLFDGSAEDKAEIVIEEGRRIEDLERRIKEYQSGSASGA